MIAVFACRWPRGQFSASSKIPATLSSRNAAPRYRLPRRYGPACAGIVIASRPTAYNEALKRRGCLSIWFDPQMDWAPPPSGKRGRQQQFSDAAIQTCLTLKVLFGIPSHGSPIPSPGSRTTRSTGSMTCCRGNGNGSSQTGRLRTRAHTPSLINTGCRGSNNPRRCPW